MTPSSMRLHPSSTGAWRSLWRVCSRPFLASLVIRCSCVIAARVLILAEWTPMQIEDLALKLYAHPTDMMPPYTLQVRIAMHDTCALHLRSCLCAPFRSQRSSVTGHRHRECTAAGRFGIGHAARNGVGSEASANGCRNWRHRRRRGAAPLAPQPQLLLLFEVEATQRSLSRTTRAHLHAGGQESRI